MKGVWIHDDQRDVWHLIWEQNHPDDPDTVTWCGQRFPIDTSAERKGGAYLGMADVLHDECVRKSEEL